MNRVELVIRRHAILKKSFLQKRALKISAPPKGFKQNNFFEIFHEEKGSKVAHTF